MYLECNVCRFVVVLRLLEVRDIPSAAQYQAYSNEVYSYCTWYVYIFKSPSMNHSSLTRVTKSYLSALGTTQISSCFTKHWTKFLTHQTGIYPVCFVSKPSRITLVELSIINTSYQKLPFGSGDYPDKLLFHQALNYVSNSSNDQVPNILRYPGIKHQLSNVLPGITLLPNIVPNTGTRYVWVKYMSTCVICT